MTFRLSILTVPLMAAGLAACSSLGSSVPTTEDMNVALSTAESPEQRCLLHANFVEDNPGFMRVEDLTAGYNSIQANAASRSTGPFVTMAYDGYSRRSAGFDFFMKNSDPLRARLYRAYELSRKFKGAKLGDDPVTIVSPLEMVESAMLALDAGDPDCAAVLLDTVQEVDDVRQAASGIARLFQDGKLRGYEQVMLANYRALAYLMTGDSNAIPAARAARSVLEYQREKYGDEIARVEAERDAEQRKEGQNKSFVTNNVISAVMSVDEISAGTRRAEEIRSPYLNPLSDYMSAMMAEIEATQQPVRKRGEWDTARISLQNASALLPGNQFIQSVLQKVRGYKETGAPTDTKTVHVIAATGFAPREKVLTFSTTLDGNLFLFNIDTLTPVQTYSGPIYAEAGGAQADLELLADVEAMAFRWQKDRFTARIIKQGLIALANFYVSVSAKKSADKENKDSFLGGLMQTLSVSAGAQLTKPSTESWTSLPARYRATRMEVPVSAKTVRLGIRGPNGDANSIEFKLLDQGTSVIYVRVINNKIWGRATNVPFGEGRVVRPTRTASLDDMLLPLGR